MRFRIQCTNPRTRQAHDFELESGTAEEAGRQVREAGLELGRVTEAGEPSPRRRFGLRAAGRPPASADDERRPRIVVLVLAAVVLAAGLSTMFIGNRAEPTRTRLDASARFDGFQFKITNTGTTAWHDVRLDVNGGLAHRGYELHLGTLDGRQTINVPATAFTRADGVAYNPISEPLAQFRITCDVGDGARGLYTRRWE